jgi:hypothetical protein
VNQLLHFLRRRGSVRTLLLLLVLALTGSALFTLAALRPRNEEPLNRAAYDQLMASRVRAWDDLLDWFYDQQEQMARIIPPGLEWLVQPGTPDLLVLDSEPLQKELASSKPAWLNSVPVWVLELQESISGEITIRDGAGNLIHTFPAPPDYQIPYEALFRQSLNTYTPELNRYKLRSRISLLPQEFVEPYLYVQAEIEAYARQQAAPAMQMMMSGGEDELAISGMQRVTNGLRLTVSYPASFSGQVWSVYQQNTPACISTNLSGGSGGGTPPPPDGTNGVPCTNCVSYSVDLTNSFNGLESAWALCFNNLILTGETSTSWTDTQPMGSDTNGNPVHRFYGVGSNEVDSDGDGISDATEQFLHHTLPGNSDTDGDGLPDGWEVNNGLSPSSGSGENGATGDPDQDGVNNGSEYAGSTSPTNADSDSDGMVDGYDPFPSESNCFYTGSMSFTFGYSAPFQDGTGEPVKDRDFPVTPVLPDNVASVSVVDVYGYVDDTFEIGGQQFAPGMNFKMYLENITPYVDRHDASFTIGVYDYCVSGHVNNAVGITGTCSVTYQAGLKIDIIQPKSMWWAPTTLPSGYHDVDIAEARIEPSSLSGHGTFKWEVLGSKGYNALGLILPGGGPAQTVTKTDNEFVNIFSKGYSDAIGDVTLRLTYTPPGYSSPVCFVEKIITVRTFKLVLGGFVSQANGSGWSTFRDMFVKDQFNGNIPTALDANEIFTDWQSQWAGESWPSPTPGSSSGYTWWTDWVSMPGPSTHTPEPVKPTDTGASTPVDSSIQTWRYGSTSPGAGDVFIDGVVNLQRNLGNATHSQ